MLTHGGSVSAWSRYVSAIPGLTPRGYRAPALLVGEMAIVPGDTSVQGIDYVLGFA
jgi:hypothetical protein